ncbi:hypothetical protein H4R24_002400 [Coemansia sp. RSA 988]|nr:hypothetical protein H4R24_002400 [Coemansia sp. RSA 988]
MGRKKINISEIENSRQRTVTFARRRAGLIKKAHELSILCNIKVALVIFDSKNAGHVYSSADTPDEMFSRYLYKQFLTNESRRRNHTATDDGDEDNGGRYGFDKNGSFIRRRIAVVNEYKVASEGDNSQNLHVKYTKTYHTPNENAPSKRLSTASTSSAGTLNQGPQHTLISSPLSVRSSLNEAAAAGAPSTDAQIVGDSLPIRSAPLIKQGPGMMVTPAGPSFVDLHAYGQVTNPGHASTMYHYNTVEDGTGRIDPELDQPTDLMATAAADNIKLVTHDHSPLSFFSDSGRHAADSNGYIEGPDAAQGLPLDIDNVNSVLNIIRANMECGSRSPLSVSRSSDCSVGDGTGMADLHQLEHEYIKYEDCEEPKAKRQRHHSFSSSNGTIDFLPSSDTDYSSFMQVQHTDMSLVDKCEIDQELSKSLVEDFLSNANVEEVLKTSSWGKGYADNRSYTAEYPKALFGNAADKDDMSTDLSDSDSDGGDDNGDDDVRAATDDGGGSECGDDDDGGYTENEDAEDNEQLNYPENEAFQQNYSEDFDTADATDANQLANLQMLGQQNTDLQTQPNIMHSLQCLGIMPMDAQLATNNGSQQTFYGQTIGATGITEPIFDPTSTAVSMSVPLQSYGLDAASGIHYTNNFQSLLANHSQLSVADNATSTAPQQYNLYPDLLLSAYHGKVF